MSTTTKKRPNSVISVDDSVTNPGLDLANSTTTSATTKQKKTNYACVRCRKRHIKCPSGNPCSKCKAAGATCEYAEADKKVVISVKYLQRLHEEISTLKKTNAILRSKNTSAASSFIPLSLGAETELIKDFANSNTSIKQNTLQPTKENKNKDGKYLNEVVPPFVDRQRRLVCSKTGEKFYVGSSSMTLFGLEVESMIPGNVLSNSSNTRSTNGEMNPNEKLSTILEREGNAYRIYLGKTETRPGMSVKFTLPSYSYAMLLIDTFITYNDGCFYFFNEGLVKESLRKTYSNNLSSGDKVKEYPVQDSIIETINFCKFLLIFAIGEMYLGTANDNNGTKLASPPRLPGSGFFQQASELFTGLFASGAIDNVAREGGVEVMLLYAFYLQVADCTVASYFYFGIALRASLILGLHVDVEKDTLSRFELEHRRRLWWTVYMFERMLSSKAGLPLSLSDDSISTELPQDFDMSSPSKGCEHYIFPEAEYIKNCVTIVQINALILSSLYQKEPTTNILPVIAELITKLFKWKENLPSFLKPSFLTTNFKISRLVTNIMTEYFQGINLAVRPLLFYLTTKQIKINKTSDVYIDLTKYSESILTLLNASFQGSINTIRSLWALMPENMVALFGYMDREYLFTSAATLILFNVAFGVHEATKDHLDHALSMFTKMRNLGNNPAELRRAQLLKLMQTLNFNSRMDDLINKFDDNLEYEKSLSAKKDLDKKDSDTSKRQRTDTFPTKLTFNKKLLNKEKRKQVNNNRFIYQKNRTTEGVSTHSSTTSTPQSSTFSSITDTTSGNHEQKHMTFGQGNIHDINDLISINNVNHPVSNTRSEIIGYTENYGSSNDENHKGLHGSMVLQVASLSREDALPLLYPTANGRMANAYHGETTAHASGLGENGSDTPASAQRIDNSNVFGQASLLNNQQNMLESLIKTDFSQPYSPFNPTSIDNELWDEITNQPTWLNDVSEEFQNLMNNIK